jgi:hypothetical protein
MPRTLTIAAAVLWPAAAAAQQPSPPIPPAVTSVTVTPRSVSLLAGSSQRFTAAVAWSDDSVRPAPVHWAAQGGGLSNSGVYRAGPTSGVFRLIAGAGGKADTVTVRVESPIPAPPSLPRGSLIYDAHFESGGWPKRTVFDTCDTPSGTARVHVYSNAHKPAGAPDARMGSHAVAVTVLDTDVAPCTPTSNPRASSYIEDLFRPGDTVWETFSIYVPNDFPLVSHFMMFQEDYGPPFHSTPPNGFYIQNFEGTGNRFYITGDYDPATKKTTRVWSGPLTTGVWHDWLVHKKLTPDESGFLEVWLDGRPLTFTNGSTHLGGQQTMLAGATRANFSLMQYRQAGMFPMDRYPDGLTIYFDEARVGSTREVVEQGR